MHIMLYLFCEKNHKKGLSHYFSIFLSCFYLAEKQSYFFTLFPCTLKIHEIAGVDFPSPHFPFQRRSPSHKWMTSGSHFCILHILTPFPDLPQPHCSCTASPASLSRVGFPGDRTQQTTYKQRSFPIGSIGHETSLIFWCCCPWQSWLPALSKQESSGPLERHLALLPFASLPSSPSSVHPG